MNMKVSLEHICKLQVVLLMLLGLTSGAVRRYYIAARDVAWDYAPQGTNLGDPKDQASADVYLKQSLDRIGHTYKKTSYFQFTDDTFTKEVYKRPLLGILGPIIHAEVGDTLVITYLNNATQTYSAHPHGLFYLKDGESAVYLDGTSGKFKHDEIVLPGQQVTLTWNVTDSDAPGEGDPNCLPWLYHSHVDTPRDTSAGVTGILVTCRKGVLDADNERTDVDVEMPIFVKNYDENLSWHLDDNINTFCLNPVRCRSLRDSGDEDFTESNYMRSINGYMFGHLPELEACVGHRVALYIIGFGNEFDVHSMHFHGQTLKYQHTKGDTVSVYSATFVAAEMVPREIGYWHLTDMVGRNEQNGVSAFLFTKSCPAVAAPTVSLTGTTRAYFVSADEVTWDYGPGGKDRATGLMLTTNGSHSDIYFEKSSTRVGGVYTKAVFRQYSDATFTKLAARPAEEEHMGILGPLLWAEVGDALLVTLRNAARYPVSLLAHGLVYSFQEEATGGNPATVPGGYVDSGKIHTYVFRVPDDFLDNVTEPCLNFLYSSGHNPSRDHNSGLVGPILICKRGYSSIAAKPKEFFLLLSTFDENMSMYVDDNVRAAQLSKTLDRDDPDFQESNRMFSLNGYSFGNIPGLSMCYGESVFWYVMSLGSDGDVHTVTFDGNPFSEKGKHRDSRHLVPGSTAALVMDAKNIGSWEVMSHSTSARDGGMYGFYEVVDCGHGDNGGNIKPDEVVTPAPGGAIREYFVAAEEVEWDYAPLERSIITGQDLNDPRVDGHIFIRKDNLFIGTVYKKAVFRGYTDASFTNKVSGFHENILGPTLRAEVGDLIKVTFMNKANQLYSMHSRGVKTSQSDSGTNYGQAVAAFPGKAHVYNWQVPPSAGPGPSDPNCIPWLYYSAVDPTRDVNSGLMGALVICRPGTLDKAGYRTDVDEELFVLMSVMNENLSWYLDENVKKFAPGRVGTDYENDEDFEESNLMHAVNGRVFGNNPGLYVEYGTKVTWYLMSLGAEVDLHSFHLHGHTFVHTSEKHREDVMQLFPGQAEAVEMLADNPGTWLLHCHVLDHIQAGMETTYTVLEKGVKVPANGSSPNIHFG